MDSPINFISSFIEELKNNNDLLTVDIVITEFYKKSVMAKYYEEEKLLLVYHKYDIPAKSILEKMCRSLVIDTETWKILSYSCQNPICNKEAQQLLLNSNQTEFKYHRCYEGSLLSLFNHNDKWYLSTRRCLNSKDSKWNETSHWDMFNSVLTKDNLSFDEFCSHLDPTCGYHFVLIHYNLKNIVNYTKEFGPEYTKLCLVFIRNKETQEELDLSQFPKSNNIFIASEVDIDQFSNENKKIDVNVDNEGIVTKIIINNTSYLLKLQTLSYQFFKAMGSNSNIYKGYIHLYQSNTLKEYLSNDENKNLGKINNPYKSDECFDIIGIVDSVFKVLTSELFELFKLLWNFKTNHHQNVELYKILPKEYKDILFALRGLYFQVKTSNMTEPIKVMFGIKNIYNFIKELNVEQICALLRQRKLMFNWIIISENTQSPPIKVNENITKSSEELKLFRKISEKCDKVHCKLIAIYINKLFPDIISTDLPY